MSTCFTPAISLYLEREVSVMMTVTQQNVQRCGLDFGGTQAGFLPCKGCNVIPLPTESFSSMDDAVHYIVHHFGKPTLLVIGAAGDVAENGEIKLTNRPDWPTFSPNGFDFRIRVVNDMFIKAAGLNAAEVEVLRGGRSIPGAIKTVVTISSGVGNAQLLADGLIISSEGGHTTWQPANELEDRVLQALRRQHDTRYFSVEELISGKHMFMLYDALVACGYEPWTNRAHAYIEQCRRTGVGIGPYLTDGAIRGEPFCVDFMAIVGSLLGQYLRNLAVFTLAKGGIYLTGGVMQPAVARYLFKRTPLLKAFAGGRTHNDWLSRIPIYLVTDTELGAKGALQLALAG
jgi:glucokinase